jgi:hypothetical protein
MYDRMTSIGRRAEQVDVISTVDANQPLLVELNAFPKSLRFHFRMNFEIPCKDRGVYLLAIGVCRLNQMYCSRRITLIYLHG